MKTIKSYKEINLTVESKKAIYNQIHQQEHLQTILSQLPKGKSVWIDSNGDGTQENIVVFEHRKWQGIFDPRVPIKYYDEFESKTMVQAINKYITPTSIVIHESEEFRYVTPEELCKKINYLDTSFDTKILLYVNMIFIDYNKLKFTKGHIINHIVSNFGEKIKVHVLDNFKYLLEVN